MRGRTVSTLKFQMIAKIGRLCLIIEMMHAGMLDYFLTMCKLGVCKTSHDFLKFSFIGHGKRPGFLPK